MNGENGTVPARIRAKQLTLHSVTVEKTFLDCVMDLKEVIILDGIDILPDSSGFRVRSHDLYGPLPEVVVRDSGDTYVDKDRLGNEACKLWPSSECGIEWFDGSQGAFLVANQGREPVTVGYKVGQRTWLAEGEDFVAAYHDLHKRVVVESKRYTIPRQEYLIP